MTSLIDGYRIRHSSNTQNKIMSPGVFINLKSREHGATIRNGRTEFYYDLPLRVDFHCQGGSAYDIYIMILTMLASLGGYPGSGKGDDEIFTLH